MTVDTLLWSLLLVTATLVMALPLYPVWARRRSPDQGAWPPSAANVHGPLRQDLPFRASLRLPPGARFEQLHAGRIILGAGTMPLPAPLPALERWQPPIDARPWGLQGWHVARALDIAPGQRVPCALAVRGQLHVRGPGVMEGDVRVRDSVRLGAGSHVRGNLFSGGDIRIGPGCSVRGLVMAEGKLHLSPGVVIGSPQQLVSVCADVIEAEGPVQIHGTVHARILGLIAHWPDVQANDPRHPHRHDLL